MLSLKVTGRRYTVTALLGCVLLMMSGPGIAAPSQYDSVLLTEEDLKAHGLNLQAVSGKDSPAVSAEDAAATAQSILGIAARPADTFRILASAMPGLTPQTAWLVLFEGGALPPSRGPAGSENEFKPRYTGVLIDDRSGKLVYWFEGGSVSP